MAFNERIKRLREEKNLSYSQMAALVDKSEGAIRSWETERSKPDIDTLIKLAQYFNCTTDYLLGLSDVANDGLLEQMSAEFENYTKLDKPDRRTVDFLIEQRLKKPTNKDGILFRLYLYLNIKSATRLKYSVDMKEVPKEIPKDEWERLSLGNLFMSILKTKQELVEHQRNIYALKGPFNTKDGTPDET